MKVHNTKAKAVATLSDGSFLAREYRYSCPRCATVVGSQELSRLVAQRSRIGYDVLVAVGKQFFLDCRNTEHIVGGLQERNICVSRSEVSYLARKFIVYLALLHKKASRRTKAFLSVNGGYILHLDGTCEGESPHLISVLDGITEIVLDNAKVASENAEELIPFLEGIKGAYGNPVAVVSDMGAGILAAVATVFSDVPSFICHYHFLRNLGKELFGGQNDIIRNRLKGCGIQGILRKRCRVLCAAIASAGPQPVESFIRAIEIEGPTKPSVQIIVHCLLQWALEGKNDGQGRGFPFDQPHLVFYRRLVAVYALLGRLRQAGWFGDPKEKRLYGTIRGDLQLVIRDLLLKRTAADMLEKVEVFARLRKAMRISLAHNKQGLNDEGELCDIKTIEKEVTKFVHRLNKDSTRMQDKAYRKLIDQIAKYRHMLFCDPIVVDSPAGKLIIQPQRTNNVLEQFFRALMRSYRKKNGFQAMEKALKAMLKDTPLVMNLRNSAYVELLLAGKKDLAERFADIDIETVRRHMKPCGANDHPVPAKLKRMLSSPTFPQSLEFLLANKAS